MKIWDTQSGREIVALDPYGSPPTSALGFQPRRQTGSIRQIGPNGRNLGRSQTGDGNARSHDIPRTSTTPRSVPTAGASLAEARA